MNQPKNRKGERAPGLSITAHSTKNIITYTFKFEKEKNTMPKVNYEGKTYTLIRGDACLTGTHENPYYEAYAICDTDTADEDGWQPGYTVKWEILEDYNPEEQEEEYACDWDEPMDVLATCEYNATEDRIV